MSAETDFKINQSLREILWPVMAPHLSSEGSPAGPVGWVPFHTEDCPTEAQIEAGPPAGRCSWSDYQPYGSFEGFQKAWDLEEAEALANDSFGAEGDSVTITPAIALAAAIDQVIETGCRGTPLEAYLSIVGRLTGYRAPESRSNFKDPYDPSIPLASCGHPISLRKMVKEGKRGLIERCMRCKSIAQARSAQKKRRDRIMEKPSKDD